MPRCFLIRSKNKQEIQEHKNWDAAFCKLFWNPFANPDQPIQQKQLSKSKEDMKHPAAKTNTTSKHKCSTCDRIFRWPGDLEYHEAYVHRNEQLNRCSLPECGRNFQFPHQLAKHQRACGHHNWQIACTACGKLFASQRFLSRHTSAACEKHWLRSKNNPKQNQENA